MRLLCTLFVSSFLSPFFPEASAQRTWTVDAANGPGTDFLDVPPALAAASSGDTILVRPGRYQAGSTSKGITLLGQNNPALEGLFDVTALPAGSTFVMKGFVWADRFWIKLNSCAGRIHLEKLQLRPQEGEGYSALKVSSCSQVTITALKAFGGPALSSGSSSLSIVGCLLNGINAVPHGQGATAAVSLQQSAVVFSGGTVVGGMAMPPGRPAAPAMQATGGTVTIGGPRTTMFAAGGDYVVIYPRSAIEAYSGTILVDPVVQLVPQPGAMPISGDATVTTRRFPATMATGGPAGGSLTAELFSPANDVVVMLLGLPGPQIAVPGVGEVWIDPRTAFVGGSGVQGPSEVWSLSLPIPLGVPPGLPLMVQGLSGPSGALVLSTPTGIVLH